MMADATDDTGRIERDLAATRARMDRRLDELGDKLAPNQLVSDTLAQVTGGDGAAFATGLIGKAKANPLPAVLAAIGIVWLMASSKERPTRSAGGEPDLPTRLRSAEAGVVRLHDEDAHVHAGRIDDARGQVLGIARSATDSAATYGQRIKEAMAAAAEALHDAGRGLADGASQARPQGTMGSLLASPLVIGAGSALVGIVAGVLVPVSDQEARALGGVAGELRRKGSDLAQDVADRGAQLAGDALGAAQDSAQAHGLTPDRPVGELLGDLKSGALLGHVKEAAQEVVSAGKDSVQSQLGERDGDAG